MALDHSEDWIIADQVYFELYKALRNPRIFEKPYGAEDAFSKIEMLREQCGLRRCSYVDQVWDGVSGWLKRGEFPLSAHSQRSVGLHFTESRNHDPLHEKPQGF